MGWYPLMNCSATSQPSVAAPPSPVDPTTGEPLLTVAVRNTRRIMREFAMRQEAANQTVQRPDATQLHDVALTAVRYAGEAVDAAAPHAQLVFSKVCVYNLYFIFHSQNYRSSTTTHHPCHKTSAL